MADNGQNVWERYPAALPKDTILAGKYIIKDVLGQGGFGITYLAEEYKSKRDVAVKEFFPETMAMRGNGAINVKTYTDERLENFRFGMESFLEEAKVLAQFKGNPHIVGVQQYFEENGTAYFVMDYIEGIDFKTYIKQKGGNLPWEEVWRIMSPVMEALDAVHKKGLIHRDVTPDNIFISNDGTVKLLDFGASRYSLGDRSKSLDVVLKAGYAPKEQYIRRGKQGPFTDVYSVAACFYASLSGFLPPESLERLEDDNLVMLSARGVRLTDKTEEAIMKALEVRAEDRFQSMEEFRQAIIAAEPKVEIDSTIESEIDTKSDAKSVQQSSNVKKFSMKKRKGVVIGGVSAVIVAIVIAVVVMQSGSTKIKDGYNTYAYTNGDVYEGEFKDGERDGQGKYRWANGKVYEGEWKEGEIDGSGKMTYANGEVYEGEFKEGNRNGQGKYIWATGDVYEGEWEDEVRKNGNGKMTYVNGNIHEGTFIDGKLNGQGKVIYANGDIYEGEWKDGVRKNGNGKMTYINGNIYEGTFVDGKLDGQGKMTYANGDIYEGEWKDGSKNDGWGKITYADGVYEGEFKYGKRIGQGRMTYTNGDIYEGQFKAGYRNGQGKYTYANGTVVKGTWKDGEYIE